MRHFLPAVCYHPTTVVFIDDNREFLQHVTKWLNHDEFAYRTFDHPKIALEFLTRTYHPHPFTERCTYQPSGDTPWDCSELGINIRNIHHEMHNPKRFAEIGVIVVDYAMPGMNGIELCTKLEGLPFKKIMLTGEADEHLAVTAFNHGIIDHFIRKDDANFYALINQAIREMQAAYFQNSSLKVIDAFANLYPPKKFLADPVFINFFDGIFNALHPAEYYLTDQDGGFTFLDTAGRPQWLAVKNQEEMASFATYAAEADIKQEEVIKLLKELRAIPYFHTDEEMRNTGVEEWLPFMHPAQCLRGEKDTYYYAIISNSKAHDIGDVLSFAKYLKNLH